MWSFRLYFFGKDDWSPYLPIKLRQCLVFTRLSISSKICLLALQVCFYPYADFELFIIPASWRESLPWVACALKRNMIIKYSPFVPRSHSALLRAKCDYQIFSPLSSLQYIQTSHQSRLMYRSLHLMNYTSKIHFDHFLLCRFSLSLTLLDCMKN